MTVRVPTEDDEVDEAFMDDVYAKLEQLRRPFPPERIEKLPKPLYKGAWDGERGGRCAECGGYHVLANCIHLDYVGHANCTERLLEVDPLWEWEPLAYTEQGLPLFSDGGMWIKLTVCGVTRIGFGDGKSIKEVIGDAIRNAAMRFGVALDLWAKVDLHEGVNTGDGKTQAQSRQQAGGVARRSRSGDAPTPSADPPRAANQDALDQLGSVCDSEGVERSAVRALYITWAADKDRPDTDILDAASDDILDFAAHLVDAGTGPAVSGEPGDGAAAAGAAAAAGGPSDDDGASGDDDAPLF